MDPSQIKILKDCIFKVVGNSTKTGRNKNNRETFDLNFKSSFLTITYAKYTDNKYIDISNKPSVCHAKWTNDAWTSVQCPSVSITQNTKDSEIKKSNLELIFVLSDFNIKIERNSTRNAIGMYE